MCCPGALCNGSSCCNGSKCVADGATCTGSGTGAVKCQAGRCGCGGNNEPCCGGNRCTDPAAQCLGSSVPVCRKCGVRGGPCCNDSTCNDGADVCDRTLEICRKCGVAGGPCCSGLTCGDGSCCVSKPGITPLCIAQGDFCPESAGICQNGACGGTCGALGMVCCGLGLGGVSNWCAQSGTHCEYTNRNPIACEACGGKDQPCCGSASTISNCRTGLKCMSQGAANTCR